MAKSRRTRIVPGREDREHLERIRTNPQSIFKHVHRASIDLCLGDGPALSKPTVWRWWDRFLAEGVDCLLRDFRGKTGAKPVPEEKVRETIELSMSPPPEHASHWTLRALAERLGIAVSTVLGDAELILGLTATGEAKEGQARIAAKHMASIDSRPVREPVEEILEGGKAAFEMRRSMYGF